MRLYREYGDRAEFFLVYIREAHPTDSRRPDRQIKVEQPETLEERGQVAGACVADLGLDMPTLLDDMENTTEGAYHAWPDRLFLVGRDGVLSWKSDPGPRGFKPELLEAELKKLPAPTEGEGDD